MFAFMANPYFCCSYYDAVVSILLNTQDIPQSKSEEFSSNCWIQIQRRMLTESFLLCFMSLPTVIRINTC
jgi:hypothetical protein